MCLSFDVFVIDVFVIDVFVIDVFVIWCVHHFMCLSLMCLSFDVFVIDVFAIYIFVIDIFIIDVFTTNTMDKYLIRKRVQSHIALYDQ